MEFLLVVIAMWFGWHVFKLDEEVEQIREQLDAAIEDYRKAQARYKSTLGNLQKLQREKLLDKPTPWEAPKGV